MRVTAHPNGDKIRPNGRQAHPSTQLSPGKLRTLKNRHNRIQRRVKLGMGKPGDTSRLLHLKNILGYRDLP